MSEQNYDEEACGLYIDDLQRQLAQSKAVIAKQKETIYGLNNTVRTCDELSRLARIKRDEQSELIEKLANCINLNRYSGQPYAGHVDDAIRFYNQWKGQPQTSDTPQGRNSRP